MFYGTLSASMMGALVIFSFAGCSNENAAPKNQRTTAASTKAASRPLAPAPKAKPPNQQRVQNPTRSINEVQALEKRLQNEPEARDKVVSRLEALVGDSEIRVQEAAAKALAVAGACSPESLELLLNGLSRAVGGNSFAVPLNKLGEPAIPGVLQSLKSPNATTRKNAAFCLGLTWCTAEAESRILALADVAENDTEPKVRHQAAVAMAILARHEDVEPAVRKLAIPFLTKALQDTSSSTRGHLVGVVGDMWHKGHPLIPAMIAVLKDEDVKVRGKAANALGMLACPFQAKRGKVLWDLEQPNERASSESTNLAVEALIATLSDEASSVRAEAARGLGYIGRDAAESVAALTRQLEDAEIESRLRAAEALVRVSSDPSLAIPILKVAAADDTGLPRSRWWKKRSLELLRELSDSN